MSVNGYIYKIFCKTDDEMVYYGSTTQQVCKRIKQHQYDYKSWKLGKFNFLTSFSVIETDDWDYITVESVVYDEPFELKNRERYWIQNNECINQNIPNNTQKESSKKWYDSNKFKSKIYREQNKQQIKEYKKIYYKQNEQHIKEQQKEYYKQNETQIKEYREQNEQQIKEYQKQYREQNREQNEQQIKEYQKQYREQNQEQLNEKINCGCGSIVGKCNLSSHKKTKKHQKWLETQ